MASRHLKRLQDSYLDQQEAAEHSSEEEESSPGPQAKANPFAFLGSVKLIAIDALLVIKHCYHDGHEGLFLLTYHSFLLLLDHTAHLISCRKMET